MKHDARVAIHVTLTGVMAGLGVVLMLPGDTFNTSQVWRLFRLVITEEQCALLFFLIAIGGALGMGVPSLRLVSIILLALAHGSLAMLFVLSSPHGGALIPYTAFAALGLYMVNREGRDSRS